MANADWIINDSEDEGDGYVAALPKPKPTDYAPPLPPPRLAHDLILNPHNFDLSSISDFTAPSGNNFNNSTTTMTFLEDTATVKLNMDFAGPSVSVGTDISSFGTMRDAWMVGSEREGIESFGASTSTGMSGMLPPISAPGPGPVPQKQQRVRPKPAYKALAGGSNSASNSSMEVDKSSEIINSSSSSNVRGSGSVMNPPFAHPQAQGVTHSDSIIARTSTSSNTGTENTSTTNILGNILVADSSTTSSGAHAGPGVSKPKDSKPSRPRPKPAYKGPLAAASASTSTSGSTSIDSSVITNTFPDRNSNAPQPAPLQTAIDVDSVFPPSIAERAKRRTSEKGKRKAPVQSHIDVIELSSDNDFSYEPAPVKKTKATVAKKAKDKVGFESSDVMNRGKRKEDSRISDPMSERSKLGEPSSSAHASTSRYSTNNVLPRSDPPVSSFAGASSQVTTVLNTSVQMEMDALALQGLAKPGANGGGIGPGVDSELSTPPSSPVISKKKRPRLILDDEEEYYGAHGDGDGDDDYRDVAAGSTKKKQKQKETKSGETATKKKKRRSGLGDDDDDDDDDYDFGEDSRSKVKPKPKPKKNLKPKKSKASEGSIPTVNAKANTNAGEFKSNEFIDDSEDELALIPPSVSVSVSVLPSIPISVAPSNDYSVGPSVDYSVQPSAMFSAPGTYERSVLPSLDVDHASAAVDDRGGDIPLAVGSSSSGQAASTASVAEEIQPKAKPAKKSKKGKEKGGEDSGAPPAEKKSKKKQKEKQTAADAPTDILESIIDEIPAHHESEPPLSEAGIVDVPILEDSAPKPSTKSRKRQRAVDMFSDEEEIDDPKSKSSEKSTKEGKLVPDVQPAAKSAEKENIHVPQQRAPAPGAVTGMNTPRPKLKLYHSIPHKGSVSDLIRRVSSRSAGGDSKSGSPFPSPVASPASHHLLKATRTAISRIAPLHPNRRTPPPQPPRPPAPKKTKKMLEMEERIEMELAESVEGWTCMAQEERTAMIRAKRDFELGYDD